MSGADFRTKVAQVEKLTGMKCPRSVKTAEDLQIWACLALNIANAAQFSAVKGLIESLESPEKRLQRELALQEAKAEREAAFQRTSERSRTLSQRGASVRKQQGNKTRADIIRLSNGLGNKAPRDRASIVAERLGVTPRHVRRIRRQEGVK